MAKAPQNLVALPPVVDLDALDDVRDTLIAALETGPVTVSGVGVERVATNALLLLRSAAETARRNNFEFRVIAASPAMLGAIERLGFSAPFAALLKG